MTLNIFGIGERAMQHLQYRAVLRRGFTVVGLLDRRQLTASLLGACFLFFGVSVFAEPAPASIDEATRLGQRVLAVQAALDDPGSPDAMQAITDLGLDSRYYVMVRGWLSLQLDGDRSIAAASDESAAPAITQRIEFLKQAIRAIDLE